MFWNKQLSVVPISITKSLNTFVKYQVDKKEPILESPPGTLTYYVNFLNNP